MRKNTGKKILILATVIVLAVAGVMVYYPTIVAPPGKPIMENLHIRDLSTSIDGFSSAKTYAFNDSVFGSVNNKISLYLKEGFLSNDEMDHQIKSLVQVYVPIFVLKCYDKFNASKWIESDHTAIRKRIKELKSLTVENGKIKAVTGSYYSDLGDIERIINSYYEAKKAASVSSFISVADANSKITNAEHYLNMPYIKNCSDLRNRLSNVKVRIGESHYSYVEGQVASLRNYSNMSEGAFMEQVSMVDRVIQEYDNNKDQYGSAARDSKPLKDTAAKIYDEAQLKFSKHVIQIDTNNEWAQCASSNGSYKEYQSVKNRHVPNSLAVMKIRIKGYSTFTIGIKSSGEKRYDYVMVALDKLPTVDANYSNTKEIAPNNYKNVVFSNLLPACWYTIYVVYRKDGSGDSLEDRGYVLIPNQ